MRTTQLALLLALGSAAAGASDLNPAYFSNVREVRVAQPGRQNYQIGRAHV